MGVDIDWTIVIVKTPITRYLRKHELLALSLANKRNRVKLYPLIFSELEINSTVLLSHSNYFNSYNYYQLNNYTYLERFKIFSKYGFNRQLEYKEVLIDPFIEEAKSALSSASVHCKSLTLYNLDRPCYFLFPVFDNFINLRKLSIFRCEIRYSNFINLLTKLEKLEILTIKDISLILTKSEDRNLARNLKLPVSLKELTYQDVCLGITDSYQNSPREIIRNATLWYDTEKLKIMPQIMPNLKYFKYFKNSYDYLGNKRMEEFMALNPNVEYENSQ